MATHMDVGDDRESRTGPEPGNLGLLVPNLNTALADQQVYLGSWMEKGKRVEVGIGIPGSWSECGHPKVGEMLRKKGPGMDGLHLPLRKSPLPGMQDAQGQWDWALQGVSYHSSEASPGLGNPHQPHKFPHRFSIQGAALRHCVQPLYCHVGISELVHLGWEDQLHLSRLPCSTSWDRCPLPGGISHLPGSRIVTPRRVSTGIRFMTTVPG